MEADAILVRAATSDDPLEDLTEAVFRGPLLSQGMAVREGQIQMARAVARSISGAGFDEVDPEAPPSTPLAIEAPTGLGKSLGWMVPGVLAVIRARARSPVQAGRIVVSTSGIPLQRQIFTKDIPALMAALGIESLNAVVLKGRSNYVCLHALEETETITDNVNATAEAAILRRWLNDGGSGDREDLPWEPKWWSKVSVSGEDCLGVGCPLADVCISNRARMALEGAAIVITNHSFLSLMGGRLINGSTAVMVDEAHDLEDAIRRTQTSEIRSGTGRYLAKQIEKRGGSWDDAQGVAEAVAVVMDEAADAAGSERIQRLRSGWWPDNGESPARPVFRAAKALEDGLEEDTEEVERAKTMRLVKSLRRLGARINAATEVPDGFAVWVDADQKDPSKNTVSVAKIQARAPRSPVPMVYCSATLGAGRPAEAMKAIGLDSVEELVLPSPWPLERMAVAVVPSAGPNPKEPGWEAWADQAAISFVRRCGGGVLVLATSYRRAAAMAEALKGAVPWRVRMQGEAGRSELMDWFRADLDGVLVGTRSLFQGVDVQGSALRGVLIDRIPFPSPGDPLEEAICEQLEDSFRDRSIPVAAQILRQGAGRLIRSETDRGAVLILDSRILAGWAYRLRDALSPIPISTSMEDVDRVMRGEMPQNVRVSKRAQKVTKTSSARSARATASPAPPSEVGSTDV